MIIGRLVLVSVTVAGAAAPAKAQQPIEPAVPAAVNLSTEEALLLRIAELERQLVTLDQRLRILDRQQEIRREDEAERTRSAPVVSAGGDGFQFRSADGAFALRLRGLVQSDGRFFGSDEADIAADTFVMRRVRPIVEGTVFRKFDVRLMPDFGNGRVVLQDAHLDLRFSPRVNVRAGKFKSPFGLERLASAGDLTFVERALPTSVAPNRDVGIMAYGELLARRVSYSAGAFNGVVDGSSTDADDWDGKDVVVRVFAHPFRTSSDDRLRGLGVGVATSQGTQRGTAAVPALAAYRTSGQQVFFRYLSDGTLAGTTIADGTRERISAQGYYYAGPLGLLAEQVLSRQEIRRGAVAATADVHARQLAASWVLTGELASYRGVTPRTPFDPGNDAWGAFELTARYHELRVGDELFPAFASRTSSAARAQGATVGLNWYLNRNVKIVFDYEESHFRGGTLSGDRPPARELFSRLQFAF